MVILGLDPGLRYTGWGLIEHQGQKNKFLGCGTIESADSKMPLSERLVQIFEALEKIIDTWNPAEAAVEETFINKNGQTTLKLGQARAVSLLVPGLKNIAVAEYSANLVKKTVVGSGHAGKEQMMQMMKMLLPGARFETEHEADALAVAICHAHQRGHQALADQLKRAKAK